jgi:hypothetical protein
VCSKVIKCGGVYISLINDKLATRSIKFEAGGGELSRLLKARIGVLQLRFVLPHTLRSTGVLDGVEVPAATRSRRFGLKWRVAVAPSPATAAFLHVETHVMCLCHALSGMQALSDSFRHQLEICVTLQTGIHHVFQVFASCESTSIVVYGRSASNMFGTMQGVKRLWILPAVSTLFLSTYMHVSLSLWKLAVHL